MAIFTVLAALLAINSLLVFPWALGLMVRRHGLRPSWLVWVPLVNLAFVPRLADASVLAWLLLFIPIANIYVWWDWWSEIAFDEHHPHPDRWALGMLVPYLNTYLLARLARPTAVRVGEALG
jgi:hypothetical protein